MGHQLVDYWELSRWLRHLKTPANWLVEATSCCRGPRPQEITWGGLEVQGAVLDLCGVSALGLGGSLPGQRRAEGGGGGAGAPAIIQIPIALETVLHVVKGGDLRGTGLYLDWLCV